MAPTVICYASRTGTKRNLAALRAAGWRLLISREGAWRHEGFPYALDNGAWTDFCHRRSFDGPKFSDLVQMMGKDADWVVAPDVVAGSHVSLQQSLRWLPYLRQRTKLVLIPAQDGLEPEDMAGVLGSHVGIFLGGSTEWKLANMQKWGEFAASIPCHYHVGRVNTEKRIHLAASCGAHSIDGTSASRFSVTTSRLARAANMRDMFAPSPKR